MCQFTPLHTTKETVACRPHAITYEAIPTLLTWETGSWISINESSYSILEKYLSSALCKNGSHIWIILYRSISNGLIVKSRIIALAAIQVRVIRALSYFAYCTTVSSCAYKRWDSSVDYFRFPV